MLMLYFNFNGALGRKLGTIYAKNDNENEFESNHKLKIKILAH